MRRVRAFIAVAAVAAPALAALPAGAGAAASCAPGPAKGGEWQQYGHDLANSRDQVAEHSMGPSVAASLAPAWSFSTPNAGDGDFTGTPIVAGGCVYVASTGGSVFAL